MPLVRLPLRWQHEADESGRERDRREECQVCELVRRQRAEHAADALVQPPMHECMVDHAKLD